MKKWEELLGIRWPSPEGGESLCDQSGECCRAAAQLAPWRTTLKNAGLGDPTAQNFLNQFIPYASQGAAHEAAPDGVEANLSLAAERGDDLQDVVFYHCRFLKGKNICQIYEDRPALCREFPETAFTAIPGCCGYAKLAKHCNQTMEDMREELARLKKLQQEREGFL